MSLLSKLNGIFILSNAYSQVLWVIMSRTIFIFLILTAHLTFGQKTIEYKELLKYKVDENRFDLGIIPGSWDIPCFRDYTKSNYQSQIRDSRTDSVIYTSKEDKQDGLKIIAKEIKLDRAEKSLQITGQITGGWESVIPDEFEIYVGQRIDTVSYTHIAPNLHYQVYYNGVKVDKPIIIDTVEAFYLRDVKKFGAYRGENNLPNSNYKEMLFDFKVEIDEKSILVFALSSRYAEIFEVGKLLRD